MHVVEPKSYIIAETHTPFNEMNEFLCAIGADKWDEPEFHNQGEYLIEVAGRTCYKSFGIDLNKNLTRVRTDHHEYIGNILDTHHGSVLEHATVTVGLVDVSRILTHELVRHRAGAAYSQESMRFVRMDDMGMFIPSCIKSNTAARSLFLDAVESAEAYYQQLTEMLITDDMPFSKKKEITSAIRRIAPSGHSTTIVGTYNHRAWRHLFELRTAFGVEEEIGIVFSGLASTFLRRYPAIYQDMAFTENPGYPWKSVTFKNSKV